MQLRSRSLRTLEVTVGAAAAYTAGDQVGAVQALGKVAQAGAHVTLHEVRVFDDANQSAELDVLLFSKAPADAGDNGAFVLSTADLDNLLAAGTIVAGDYNVVATRGYARKAVDSVGRLPKEGVEGGVGNLWLVVVTQGTPTYTANALRVQVTIEEN